MPSHSTTDASADYTVVPGNMTRNSTYRSPRKAALGAGRSSEAECYGQRHGCKNRTFHVESSKKNKNLS